MVELSPQKEEKQAQVFFEGFIYLRNSWASKTKVFASIIKGKPALYYTKAVNVGDEQMANNISPVYLETSLIRPDWTQIDLDSVTISQSRGTAEKFHFYLLSDPKKRITFVCRNSCTRNLWMRMLTKAKNKDFVDNFEQPIGLKSPDQNLCSPGEAN